MKKFLLALLIGIVVQIILQSLPILTFFLTQYVEVVLAVDVVSNLFKATLVGLGVLELVNLLKLKDKIRG